MFVYHLALVGVCSWRIEDKGGGERWMVDLNAFFWVDAKFPGVVVEDVT